MGLFKRKSLHEKLDIAKQELNTIRLSHNKLTSISDRQLDKLQDAMNKVKNLERKIAKQSNLTVVEFDKAKKNNNEK